MDLKVYVKSPIVHLKPLPDSTEYWEVRLGDVIVENEIYKDTNKFKSPIKPLDFIYCGKYNIKLQNLGIFRVEAETKVSLIRETNFNLTFDQPMFLQEYKVLYQQKQNAWESQEITENDFYIDERMSLRGKMEPLVAIFNHEDLMSLMKILNFNITYDDGMDKMFESIPPPSKNESSTQKKEHKSTENNPSGKNP